MFWILALKLAMGQATELEKLDNYMHTIAPHVGRNRIAYVAKMTPKRRPMNIMVFCKPSQLIYFPRLLTLRMLLNTIIRNI